MTWTSCCGLVIGMLIIFVQMSQYESIKVSPKLDFVESNEDSVAKGKSSPKIQGVRVVVDTSQLKKSIESKSMEDDDDEDEDDDSSGETKSARNSKKTVGVRTDVTFEISEEDGDDSGNKTRKQKKSGGDVVDKLDDDDDGKNRRVPVITGSSTGGGAKLNGDNDEPEQKWHVQNVPIFHGTDNRRSGGEPNSDRWDNRIPPIGIWTTEPNYYQKPRGRDSVGFKPIIPSNPWKPCVCHQRSVNYNWKPSALKPRTFVVPLDRSPKTDRVSDKLEYPFSGSASDEYSD